MLFFDGGLALIAFAVWVFCIIDVITTPEGGCRNLPKLLWLLIVVILPDVGSIAWLVAGRNWNTGTGNSSDKGNAGAAPVRTRPGRAGPSRPANPDDDEEFLAGLRARAEEQRRRARHQDQPPESS